MSSSSDTLFPVQTASYITTFQFSSWYPTFASHSIKSKIIRPLSKEFHDYLDADGVFVPEGSEDVPAESTLSDDEDEDDADEDEAARYAFPELDREIRECIKEYEAVFPKLNFSSPRDAAWILPASSPLKCTSPADVYMLLKSSDFITHDISAENVFEGCTTATLDASEYELELVLRKWYPIDKSRELRCFVRRNRIIGISQRDTNYYEFLNDPETRIKITHAVKTFWKGVIKPKWVSSEDYIFDFLLTRDLARGHILDFNPYAPRTDPLLFTYEDLDGAARKGLSPEDLCLPEFRVIDSRAHPAANSNAPTNQHNMIPFEAVNLSTGRDIEEFADVWKEHVEESMC